MTDRDPEPFQPTHCFLAQRVRLLDQRDGRFLVEFPDGSQGWHDDPLLPIAVADREAIHA